MSKNIYTINTMKKNGGNRLNIREIILGFMREQAYKPMDIKELAWVFGVPKKEMNQFKDLLKDMEQKGEIIKTRTKLYGVPEKMGLVVGKLQCHQRGYGFVIPDDADRKDLFITSSFMNGAMNGDRVIAKVTREENNGKKCEGEIIRIVERNNSTIIGVYENSKNFGFVVCIVLQSIIILFSFQGGWEDDETVTEAACREALEEAGVKGIIRVGYDVHH